MAVRRLRSRPVTVPSAVKSPRLASDQPPSVATTERYAVPTGMVPKAYTNPGRRPEKSHRASARPSGITRSEIHDRFGTRSWQFVVQPTQGLQWPWATVAAGARPYA